jgi:excisionase family DNA binding protein
MNTRETTPRLIKAKRAALDIGIPYTTLRDVALRGEIALVRVGRALYIERSDVDRWIETRKATL